MPAGALARVWWVLAAAVLVFVAYGPGASALPNLPTTLDPRGQCWKGPKTANCKVTRTCTNTACVCCGCPCATVSCYFEYSKKLYKDAERGINGKVLTNSAKAGIACAGAQSTKLNYDYIKDQYNKYKCKDGKKNLTTLAGYLKNYRKWCKAFS